MNVIPNVKNGESSRSGDDLERDGGRRLENRQRSVSKQMLAKTTFEQKQKMMEALDNAKAAELALRELVGAVRAARYRTRVDGPPTFDYDPLTLDFPALCLRCLPPPPTLYQTIPISTSSSWSVQPPDDQQYIALREHFSKEFNRFRVACSLGRVPMDDMSYPPSDAFETLDEAAEMTARAEAEANEFETRISTHLHAVYAQWNSLQPARRQEIWMLEMARGLGRKSEDISKLKKDLEISHQETAHLKIQIDELNRLQYPREFRLVSPTTVPISGELMHRLGEFTTTKKLVGYNLEDKHMHLDTLVSRAMERWKTVVKEARGNGNSLAAQRSLSGESAPSTASAPPTIQTPITPIPQPPPKTSQDQIPRQPLAQTNVLDLGSDIDADADADMDDDDSHNERLEAPVVRNGYVRIGA
ncbi:hypothetical protein M7I_7020 [Glarea lozoyensis 74030]|uniref:Uncharacterized protein n=1 Tax=Glarea lozoyensis (strain ATCC 74030 / MF5533) TaxID=1104152 RepID=H0EW60_GLAL7|nr:hypothetical protein M7I_7020 [Glarea lozoyensis 74030]